MNGIWIVGWYICVFFNNVVLRKNVNDGKIINLIIIFVIVRFNRVILEYFYFVWCLVVLVNIFIL